MMMRGISKMMRMISMMMRRISSNDDDGDEE